MMKLGAVLLFSAAMAFSALAASQNGNGNGRTCGANSYKSPGGCLDARDKGTGKERHEELLQKSPWS